MKYLPVPPLRQSLDRYLMALSPLLDDSQQQRAESVVEKFATVEGPACQDALLHFADEENAAGRSWLSRAWLSIYLTDRYPLALSSNVGFRIRLVAGGVGVDRAAEVIHRVASVHLSHLRGELEAEVDPRGNPVDMSQWQILAGGLRRPRPVEDVFLEGRSGAAGREIGVLWKGRLLMVPISDDAGHPPSRRTLVETLNRMQEMRLPEDDTFTHLSYLGSEKATRYLDALLEDQHNAEVHRRLVDTVFLVNLTDTPASAEEHQERVTFEPGQAWVYKPFTYQISLVDDFVGVHSEHSVVDGATLRSMIKAVQRVPSGEDEDDSVGAVHLEPLTWTMTSDHRAALARDVASYRRMAEQYRVRIHQFPVAVPPDLPFSVSHDAIQQLTLLFAQMSTYGRPRSVYEAVDVREFQAGRTECLRPVTPAALQLVQAMINGSATPDLLFAALSAHKEQVIACKTGQGFDRHLMGLRLMADRLELQPDLFVDESYRLLTTDFLSTSSVGTAEQIVRFTFAPTSDGGIGVNYTLTDGMYEFCMTHRADQVEHLDEFVAALDAGVSSLRELVEAARDS